MNRVVRTVLSSLVAAGLLLAPTAAGAVARNTVIAVNTTNGSAVIEASVQYVVESDRVVDAVNTADARARCTACQTVAVAFQIVLVTGEFETFSPRNRAFAINTLCAGCLTAASAKQVIVATGGPASLTPAGDARIRALEARLEALESDLPTMTPQALEAELDAAYAELLAIAREEVMRTDGGPSGSAVLAARSA